MELYTIDTELDILYSPSKWSKRENVLDLYTDFVTKESAITRKEIPCKLDIVYGEQDREKYDLFGTDLPDNAAIYIYIHGGYWQSFSKNESSYIAQPLYKNNIKTIIIGYTLCPEVKINDIVQEIEKAMKKCIEYAKKCGSRGIYMSGHSAGAHLLSCMMTKLIPTLSVDDQAIIKCLILCSGVYDVTPIVHTSMNYLLGLTPEDAKTLSSMFYEISPLNCTVYVVVGEYDSPAFINQSYMFYNKFKTLCKASYKVIEDMDHFELVERMKYDDYELVKFVLEMEKI